MKLIYLFICSAVTLMPAIFKLCKDIKRPEDGSLRKKSTWIIMFLDVIAIVFQIVGIIVWPAVNSSFSDTPDEVLNVWAFPIGLILTSFGWWESFVSEESKIPSTRYLWRVKTKMIEGQTRYVTYLFITLWKILLSFIYFIGFSVGVNNISESSKLFDVFKESFHGNGYTVSYTFNGREGTEELSYSNNLVWKILVTQVCCGYATYIFGKFACKVNIQTPAFALPITLVMPASIITIMGLCEVRSKDPCVFGNQNFPNHLFFQCPMDYADAEGYDYIPRYVFSDLYGWVWILVFLSQCWIVAHIWKPKSRKIAKTEQLFGTPYYNGLLTDQSMMLNRRSDKGQLNFRLDFQMRRRSSLTRT